MTKYITSYKELLAQCEAERAAAAEIKALPELTGSEKQIAWALDIRARKFAALNEMLASMTTTDEQLRRKNQIAIQATKNVLGSKTDSRFWIDNRNVEARKLIAANNLQDDLKVEFARLAAEASATEEVDADEYAVSTEAQEVAINAEIELATATDTTDEISIDDATYRTILLHAEKISNGQNSFAAVLKNELRNLLNADASELIEAIKTDSNYLNRVRCYLADFPLIITNDEGTRYHLVKLTDDCCELDIINDAATTTEQEENTMTTTTDADRILAERKTMTRRELFLEAKKEITYKLNARGAKIWYISYPQYDIRGKYIGHTPALKCTRKEVVTYLRDNYCGLTVDDFLAEQKAWIDEETTKAINQMNIDDQAEHVSDKVACEVKPCDDNDDVFALLPELDELNDQTETDPWFIDDPAEYTDRDARFNHGERHAARLEAKLRKIDPTVEVTYNINEYDEDTYYLQYDGIYRTPFALEGLEDSFYDLKRYEFEMKLAELQTKRDAAQAALLKAQEEHEAAENTLQKFLSDTAGNLATKLQSLNGNLDYSIKLVTENGYSWTVTDFSDIYVDPFGSGKMFAFTDWRSRRYARYDTPAQVDKVIDMLRAAIERGETEFKFPTVGELNQPPMDTNLERKIKIEDSLRRAMEIATAEQERFLRLAATSYNKGTRKDCLREADNELKLYNICWQATNELWSERW